MNYFELLGIEKDYNQDPENLRQSYLTMQVRYHPDKAASEEEKRHNLIRSADLNTAYTVLKDDLKRAEYMLSLENIDFHAVEIRNQISGEKLEQIWSALEEIEKETNIPNLKLKLERQEQKRRSLQDSIALAFRNKNLHNAIDLTISLKYLVNLIEKVKLKIQNATNRD